MTYTPSFEDLPKSGYVPQLSDIPDMPEITVPKKPMSRTPQVQEQYSNPTQWPGFSELPKEEQLKRIQFSQFDPANQTSLGTFVPPGTYEQPSTRMAASVIPSLFAPQMAAGPALLRGGLNALSRIGAGTAGDIAYESPEIKNREDLKNVGVKSAGLNALLEALPLPFRTIAGMAEMFNPLKYASRKAAQIKNEYTATKSVMEGMYKPVNDLYGPSFVTVTPKKFMESMDINKSELFPDAKILYEEFMKEPTFSNLHKFQSKLGNDWARIAHHPATTEKAQLFSQMQDKIQEKIQNFLEHDPKAKELYNKATSYAKNVHYPYTATPTLKKISKGKIDVQPKSLAKSLKKGTEKTVGREERNVIPKGHALQNHLADIENRINFGNAMQTAFPTVGGAIAGSLFHPGLGGTLGGAIGGLGSSQLANVAAKFGAPSAMGFVQNPLVQKLFKGINPLYYGAGRSLIESGNY